MIYVRHFDSPLGRITLSTDGESLIGFAFEEERHPVDRSGASEEPVAILLDAERQVQEYLGGWRKSFDLPLRPAGTDFQRRVWEELLRIPFGQTISYMELAQRIGNPKAVRAVGLANGRNPISLIIPCHRVIGANGDLTGYGGGLPRKEFLLRHEGIPVKSDRQASLWPAATD
ncbi:methylated-DNA--[protein]-cysteine S-methyltransferase [Bryobacter aggregatus]|uniref:methylated-DNA--[protein]-cysteine S-methyltransferase n=1 Tax=Bryobacter aggregatus TaxID=360054 RepID=UPI0006923AC6|nr:methylated-DNA--[protein]-cysteine S-methyltransferase [Bryobacter aggregatus]